MDNEKTVMYFYGDQCEAIAPVENTNKIKPRDLPDRFMIYLPGFYQFGDCVWPVDREGLYRFPTGDGEMHNYCYYKKDNFSLLSALFHSARFEKTVDQVEHAEILAHYMRRRIETNLPMIKLLMTFLNGERVAARQVALYSPIIGNSVFDWLEVWDEQKKCWELYWTEKGTYLGVVDKDRTSFDVFDELCDNNAFEKKIIPFQYVKNDLLENAGILEEVNEALENNEKFAALVEKYKIFPVMRSEGKNILCVNTAERYKKNISCEMADVMLGGDDAPTYKLYFQEDEYIKNHIYGSHIYIISYRAIKIS